MCACVRVVSKREMTKNQAFFGGSGLATQPGGFAARGPLSITVGSGGVR